MSPTPRQTLFRPAVLLLSGLLVLTGCKAPDLRPGFLKREKPEAVVTTPTPTPAPAPAPAVDPSLTPRELLSARLVNARADGDAVPGMTVGKLIEYDTTLKIFTNPSLKQTEDYITGRFG